MPKVSVIIPTYNQAGLLVQAVNSVVAQTFADWEIVVVDDGSTDHTPDVLADIAKHVPRLRYVRQPNAGRSAARNAGIRLAQGEYMVFLDADDWLLPQKLERQVQYLDNHAEVGVVYADAYLCDERRQVIQRYSLNEGRRHASGHVLEDLLPASFITIHSAMLRRSCVEQAGGFDEELTTGEDWDFWVRVAVCCRFEYIDEPMAGYRIHPSMVTLDPTNVLRDQVAVREKIRHLPAFARTSPAARRNFYCTYGILHTAIGDSRQGRRMFRTAIALTPGCPRPYLLLALTFLGRRGFRMAAQLKRWLSRLIGRRPPSPLPHIW